MSLFDATYKYFDSHRHIITSVDSNQMTTEETTFYVQFQKGVGNASKLILTSEFI